MRETALFQGPSKKRTKAGGFHSPRGRRTRRSTSTWESEDITSDGRKPVNWQGLELAPSGDSSLQEG